MSYGPVQKDNTQSTIINNPLQLTGQGNETGFVQTGTILTSPTAGNPNFWLQIIINGAVYAIPCWTVPD